MRIVPSLALAATLATPALADEPLALTYEMFEASVLHADIEECPTELASEGRFCRATLYADAIHIFVFSEDGDQPLVDFLSYEGSDLHTILKTPMPD
ncbi:hypothetical protein [Thalassovita sp.]|uniref:hypothetical protein n=1 Tax=Thalassovita sp. TaxID=1979401 RepID=UPI0029DE6320|nr:hypothetical protein [Thalassovita sp.]